jgi:hypothetical protein
MAGNDFEVMQICENGHIVTATALATPSEKKEYCSTCGAKALTACPACQEQIRYKAQALQRLSGALGFGQVERPRYCAKCGKAFPWQSQAIGFLKDIGREAALSAEELEQYERAVDDVAQDNVRAVRSATKVLAVALKLGKPAYAEAAKLMREIAGKTVLDSVGLGD